MTHEVFTLSKSEINLEIKRLRSLQNQHRGEKEIFDRYGQEILNLTAQRDRVVASSHQSFFSGLRPRVNKVGGGSTQAAHIAAALEAKED